MKMAISSIVIEVIRTVFILSFYSFFVNYLYASFLSVAYVDETWFLF